MKSRKLSVMCVVAVTLFATVPIALAGNKWYVDGVNGSNKNNCQSSQTACKTIVHAITLASAGDSISLAPATYEENIGIPISLEIIGSGAATTIIDGGRAPSQVIIVGPGPTSPVTLSHMTIRNGSGQGDGGGVYNCDGYLTISDSIITSNHVSGGSGTNGYGGAIYNCPQSTLTIINTTISGNSAEEGGAICSGGSLNIVNSTLTGNTAHQQKGGAIRNYGTLKIKNSTISGNSAPGGIGGGIHNGTLLAQQGTAEIDNSTLGGNTAGRGGSIFVAEGTVTIQNSIVANLSGNNCDGTASGSMTSNGYNLSSDSSCNFNGPGDMNSVDPQLGPLQNNGGPTNTMALLPGSPAIDSGNPSGCTDGRSLLKTDQRGMPRPDKEDSGACDRGAYELQQPIS